MQTIPTKSLTSIFRILTMALAITIVPVINVCQAKSCSIVTRNISCSCSCGMQSNPDTCCCEHESRNDKNEPEAPCNCQLRPAKQDYIPSPTTDIRVKSSRQNINHIAYNVPLITSKLACRIESTRLVLHNSACDKQQAVLCIFLC